MSNKELEIFELCEKLAKLLGDKEAIADLKTLHERHPEMFKDKEEVKEVIERVVGEPDIIIKNPRARSEKDYIVTKKLNSEKMGDVGIRNDKGTNVAYHANNKKIEEFDRLQDKIEKGKLQVVGTPTSYTQAQSLDGLVENNISPAESIIPQKTTNSLEKEQNQIKHTKDKSYFRNKMQTFKTNKAVKNKDKDIER